MKNFTFQTGAILNNRIAQFLRKKFSNLFFLEVKEIMRTRGALNPSEKVAKGWGWSRHPFNPWVASYPQIPMEKKVKNDYFLSEMGRM